MKLFIYLVVVLFVIILNAAFMSWLTDSYAFIITEGVVVGGLIGWFGGKHYDLGHF